MNEKITAKEVRLISVDGEQLGIVPTEEALERAQEDGLDLMEVSPNADPPVCRILNFGKLKYEEKKKIQINKKKQHVIKLKEIRLRPRIEDHDLMTKLNMGKKFLNDGCKLKITLIFRGRELQHSHLGNELMAKIKEDMKDIGKIELHPKFDGKQMIMVIQPL